MSDSKYIDLYHELQKRLPVHYTKWHCINAVYCKSEDDLKLYIDFCKAAKTTCMSYCYIDTIKGDWFRGEDWYFFEGTEGNQNEPSDFSIETLTEKKAAFHAFCREMEETLNNRKILEGVM